MQASLTPITDRILPYLAVAYLLMILLLLWMLWLPLSFAFEPHKGSATAWVLHILWHGVALNTALLLFVAWAFYRRWRYLLLFFIPYNAYMYPLLWESIVLIMRPHNLTPSLAGNVWTFSLTIVLTLTLITTFIFIIERIRAFRQNKKDIN